MANLQQEGKIVDILPATTFTKKDGTTGKTVVFAIEFSEGQYSKTLAFEVNNEKTIEFLNKFKAGDFVTAHYNADSRKWENRYFTTARCWKIEGAVNESSATQQAVEPQHEGKPDEQLPF